MKAGQLAVILWLLLVTTFLMDFKLSLGHSWFGVSSLHLTLFEFKHHQNMFPEWLILSCLTKANTSAKDLQDDLFMFVSMLFNFIFSFAIEDLGFEFPKLFCSN